MIPNFIRNHIGSNSIASRKISFAHNPVLSNNPSTISRIFTRFGGNPSSVKNWYTNSHASYLQLIGGFVFQYSSNIRSYVVVFRYSFFSLATKKFFCCARILRRDKSPMGDVVIVQLGVANIRVAHICLLVVSSDTKRT